MSNIDKAAVIGWFLIFVLFVITVLIVRWSIKGHKKLFDKTIQDTVAKELGKRDKAATAQAREPKPGSDAHYAAWRAEQRKKQQEKR